MNEENQFVLVTTEYRGVFAGFLESKSDRTGQNLIAAESIRAEQERKRGEALARCIESWRQHVESRKPKPTQNQLEAIQDREFRSLLFDMQLLALLQVAKEEAS